MTYLQKFSRKTGPGARKPQWQAIVGGYRPEPEDWLGRLGEVASMLPPRRPGRVAGTATATDEHDPE